MALPLRRHLSRTHNHCSSAGSAALQTLDKRLLHQSSFWFRRDPPTRVKYGPNNNFPVAYHQRRLDAHLSVPQRWTSTAVAIKERDEDNGVRELESETSTDATAEDSHALLAQDEIASIADELDGPDYGPESVGAQQNGFEKTSKFCAIDLLQPAHLSSRIQKALQTPGRYAIFEGCSTFDWLLPELAATHGLELHRVELPDDSSDARRYTLELLEHTPTEVTEQFQVSARLQEELFKPERLTLLLEDLIAYKKDHPHANLYIPWHLVTRACRGYVDAFPTFSLTADLDRYASLMVIPVSYESHLYILLENRRCGVVVVRPVFPGKNPAVVFQDALLEYCAKINHVVTDHPPRSLQFDERTWHPSEFISRAVRILGLDQIRISDEEVQPPTPGHEWQLYSSTVSIGQSLISPRSYMWPERKRSRLLSMMSVCEELKKLLQSAHREGRILSRDYALFARFWNEQVSSTTEFVSPTSWAADEIPIDGKVVSRMLETLRVLKDYPSNASDPWIAADDAFDYDWTSRKLQPNGANFHFFADTKKSDVVGRDRIESVRTRLPVRRPAIVSQLRSVISKNQVTIVKAATGSGKTTQIPQIILDQMHGYHSGSSPNIVCTQPRRVSTISVARRVSTERQQSLGFEIGYQVRFDDQSPQAPSGINYMTSGYLLRLLEADPLALLARYSHIILDEIHEQDVDSELILTALSNLFLNRPDGLSQMPKVLLMSATIDPAVFSNYFQRITPSLSVASVDIPGTSYPVEVQRLDQVMARIQQRFPIQLKAMQKASAFARYLSQQRIGPPFEPVKKQVPIEEPTAEADEEEKEDEFLSVGDESDLYVPLHLIRAVIGDILSTTTSGDILVFLPGMSDIEDLEELLRGTNPFGIDLANQSTTRLFKLHSALYETNFEVFEPVPTGYRRIVLATNIAETSVTLPDVTVVIDTGYSKQFSFDQTKLSGDFGVQWISKAEIEQRKGRAGRTQPGTYIATYSEAQYDAMALRPTPELLRTSLDGVVLRTTASTAFKYHGPASDSDQIVPGKVLEIAPSVPDPRNVAAAAQQLRKIRALTADGAATTMGKLLSRLPASPASCKAILLGLIFRCLDSLIVFASVQDDQPFIYNPISASRAADARKDIAGEYSSDKWAECKALAAYDQFRRSADQSGLQALKEKHYLKHEAYCNAANASKQIFESLQTLLGYPSASSENSTQSHLPRPLFPQTLPKLNANVANVELLKALWFSISGTRVARWNGKQWQSPYFFRILPSMQSINHISHKPKDRVLRKRRENGDILAYSFLRTKPGEQSYFAHETSVVSPLVGMLFGESLRYVEKSTGPCLVVNDWLSYKLQVDEASPVRSAEHVAKVVLEYRKALDRFLASALSTIALEPQKLKIVRERKVKAEDFNVFLREDDQPLRKLMVDSVVDILGIDAARRKERSDKRVEDYEGEREARKRERAEEEARREVKRKQMGEVGSADHSLQASVVDMTFGEELQTDAADAERP